MILIISDNKPNYISIIENYMKALETKKQMQTTDNSYEGFSKIIEFLHGVILKAGGWEKLAKTMKYEIVETYIDASKYLPPEIICEKLQIPKFVIERWKNEKKCECSVTKNCYNSFPFQLTQKEQEIIYEYLTNPEYKFFPRNYIWAQMCRDMGGIVISKHTFYRYATLLCGKSFSIKKEEEQEDEIIRIRAQKRYQILHMDSTLYRCMNRERVYIHFIMDNFSRCILGAVASYSTKSETVAQNLKNVIEKYELSETYFELYCDDGPENKKDVDNLINNNPSLKAVKVIASYKEKTSNNMIEASHHRFKNYFLRKYSIRDYEHLVELLPEIIEYINNTPLPILNTLTAKEVLAGKKQKNLKFFRKMETAKKKRLTSNQKFDCEKMCGKPNKNEEPM